MQKIGCHYFYASYISKHKYQAYTIFLCFSNMYFETMYFSIIVLLWLIRTIVYISCSDGCTWTLRSRCPFPSIHFLSTLCSRSSSQIHIGKFPAFSFCLQEFVSKKLVKSFIPLCNDLFKFYHKCSNMAIICRWQWVKNKIRILSH